MIKKKYPANRPEFKKKKVKLQVSSIAAIYRLRFLGSVFLSVREDQIGKSGRLRNFFFLVSPFLFFFFFSFLSYFFITGSDEQLCVAFTFVLHNNISGRKFYRKVYNIFFEDIHRKANAGLGYNNMMPVSFFLINVPFA